MVSICHTVEREVSEFFFFLILKSCLDVFHSTYTGICRIERYCCLIIIIVCYILVPVLERYKARPGARRIYPEQVTGTMGHHCSVSAVNLKGIWPRRAPAVHAAGGLGAFYLFVCLFVYLFIFKFSRGSCVGCLNAIYGPVG